MIDSFFVWTVVPGMSHWAIWIAFFIEWEIVSEKISTGLWL